MLRSLLVLSLFTFACSSHTSQAPDSTLKSFSISRADISPQPSPSAKPALPSYVDQQIIKTHPNTPALTVILAVKDAQKTAALITANKGTIDYDPNRGQGSSIPFIVADLPSEKLLDMKFMASLDLNGVNVESPDHQGISVQDIATSPQANPSTLPSQVYIPTSEVGVEKLRAIDAGKGLGENTIVAVLDTGVDASHPVFQDRVIFWNDATQEGRFALSSVKVDQGKIAGEKAALPDAIKGNAAVLVGVINEGILTTQLTDADQTKGVKGIDLNQNGDMDDVFKVIVGKDSASGEWIAYVNTSGDGVFKQTELSHPFMDFNNARAMKRQGKKAPYPELLQFPSEAKTIAYPLMIEQNEKGVPEFLTVGFTSENHGTHVAGIIGANGNAGDVATGMMGAAPGVSIMSIKVCAERTCTDQALLRGLIEAFYNPQGYIPDVVNLSLGDQQPNQAAVMDLLFQDLSEKFGTTFVIAEGNSGPAYRTGNGIGAFAPTIQVGAYVSKNTLIKSYTEEAGIQGAPEDSLFYFSSVGPSFTGELRPNIVAPGSALASTPLVDGGSAMLQGTSMATPMTTGAIAAMISLARSEGLMKDIDALRAQKVKAVIGGDLQNNPHRSLIGVPLAIRGLLEDTARVIPNYTLPEQGHGLIQIDQAYLGMKSEMSRVSNQPEAFFQLTINGDAAVEKFYDRSASVANAKIVNLGLRNDGEMSDATALKINTTPIEIKLVKVQEQDEDGTVTDMSGDLPFAVGILNGQTPDGVSTAVTLVDAAKQGFLSIRHLSQMKKDKTYVAQYDISQNGKRVLTMTDVVVRPNDLTDDVQQINAPGLNLGGSQNANVMAAFAATGKTIVPNRSHHYFVAVTSRDSALQVSLGVGANSKGGLAFQVNDPDGNQLTEQQVANLPELKAYPSANNAVIPIPRNADGSVKTGIYEITVTNGVKQGLQTSQYDLLIRASRFKASTQHLELATSALSKASGMRNAAAVSVMNSSDQVSMADLQVKMTAPVLMESLKPLPIEPNKFTLKRIHVPELTNSKDNPVAQVKVDFGLDGTGGGLDARIDHRLFTIKDGKLAIAYTANADESSTGTAKVFDNVVRPIGVALDQVLYAAVEVYYEDPNGSSLAKDAKGIDVEVTYDTPATTKGGAIVFDKADSTKDVFLTDLEAPDQIENAIADLLKEPGPKARSTLIIGIANPAYQISIPVTYFQ
jgi:tripeptidyl-peptidase II